MIFLRINPFEIMPVMSGMISKFFVPEEWSEKNLEIRFGAITHQAEVWINGQTMG
jgi:hypothetical protein